MSHAPNLCEAAKSVCAGWHRDQLSREPPRPACPILQERSSEVLAMRPMERLLLRMPREKLEAE